MKEFKPILVNPPFKDIAPTSIVHDDFMDGIENPIVKIIDERLRLFESHTVSILQSRIKKLEETVEELKHNSCLYD